MGDSLYDIVQDIQNNGIRWVSIIAIFTLFRRERRNYLLNKRDEANFHNQRIIMEALGRGKQWRDGPRFGLKPMDLPTYKQLLTIYCKAILKKKSNYPRRKNMNNQNINWVTLIGALLGAAKLVLQAFGIEIADEQVNEITNGAAALASIIGVLMSHRKPKVSTVTKSTTTETTIVQPVKSQEYSIGGANEKPTVNAESTK